MRLLIPALVARTALLLALVVAACGGGESDDSDPSGPGGPGPSGGGGAPDTAAEFDSLRDFIDHPMLVKAVKDSGFAGVCVEPGAPDIEGVYAPAMQVSACGGCESSIGSRTDPTQRIGYCNQQGDRVESWTTATGAAGSGSQTLLGACPAWPSAGPDEVAFTIYGATDGEVSGCSLTTVNLATYIWSTKTRSARWGTALDVIVRIGAGCAGLGVTTVAGDWFLWDVVGPDISPLARVSGCEKR